MTTRPVDLDTLQDVIHPPQTANLPADVLETAARLGVSEYLPRVLEFTRELFGVSPDVCVEEDPEIPNYTYVVFNIKVRGALEEILDKDKQWHQRLPDTAADVSGAFCLSIDVQR